MKKSGFTLIELMIIVAVIGLLSAIAIPSFEQIRKRQMEMKAESELTPAQKADNLAMKQKMEADALEKRQKAEMEAKVASIVDFGNGVYYFPFVNDEYRVMLSNFLASHPNLEFIDSDGDVVQRYIGARAIGVTVGHTVIFRERK